MVVVVVVVVVAVVVVVDVRTRTHVRAFLCRRPAVRRKPLNLILNISEHAMAVCKNSLLSGRLRRIGSVSGWVEHGERLPL